MVAIERVRNRKDCNVQIVTSLRSSFDSRRENFAIESIEKRIKVGIAGLR